jgi:hypothetical protein
MFPFGSFFRPAPWSWDNKAGNPQQALVLQHPTAGARSAFPGLFGPKKTNSHQDHTTPEQHVAERPPGTASSPAADCSLCLERLCELTQLLTKGTGRVQRLGELERGVIRVADLKQLLALQGLVAGAKGKRETLDRMVGTPLELPFLPGSSAIPGKEISSALASLNWLEQGDEEGNRALALAQQAVAAGGRHYACGRLPGLPGLREAQDAMQGEIGMQTLQENLPLEAPTSAMGDSHPASGVLMAAVAVPPPFTASQVNDVPPPWLSATLRRISQDCRCCAEPAAGTNLLGRKVLFALLEDFRQDGDGTVDDLDRGFHIGL